MSVESERREMKLSEGEEGETFSWARRAGWEEVEEKRERMADCGKGEG